LEVRLIGRNNDLIGQILKVCEDERKNKKRKKEYSVKEIVDEHEYSKDAKKKGSKLTSGTVKLMAIFLQGRRSETWEIGEEGLR